jgi:hypothetical protein
VNDGNPLGYGLTVGVDVVDFVGNVDGIVVGDNVGFPLDCDGEEEGVELIKEVGMFD